MKKLALIGDLIQDVFVYGTCDRLNPEGVAPLVTQTHTEQKLGGAGLVLANLQSLDLGVDFYTANTVLSTKTRVVVNNTTICRYDRDHVADNVQLLEQLKYVDYAQYDYVLLSDYNKGSLQNIRTVLDHITVPVIVDPKQSFNNYAGAWCIKPNLQEFERWYGPFSHATLKTFALANKHELVIVTRGTYGVTYYWQGQCIDLPATSDRVADVTGAGDCFLAGLAYALMQGRTVPDSIQLANKAAGVAVSHPGTYTLTRKDLARTVVFTNGCFDILHRGHIELLEQSRAMGDYLVVGVNSDASVRQLKGTSRPIINQWDRKKALESLRFVDEVVIFDEATPLELIKQYRPNIITKGGDYEINTVVGNELAQVVIIPTVEGYSTTGILNEIDRKN